MPFDITDAYWTIIGQPNIAWSSARFMYVPIPSDPSYLTWTSAGNRTPQPITQFVLAGIMRVQRVPSYLSAGVTVIFTQNPSLTSLYGLDPVSMDQVGTLARDTASGFGFPGGSISFQYPDFNSNLLSFSALEIQQLYIALRDYTNSVYQAVTALVFQLQGAVMPDTTVTVS
jgi:hypothetical protein